MGGLSYKSKYIDSGDAKLLGMGCVSFSKRFLQGGCRSYAGDYTEKHLVEEGDLVIATRQQSENLPILGFPAMIPSGMNGTDIIVGTNLYKVTNQSNFSNSFLFWLMRGEGYRSHVKACASGSTVRMITKDVILDYCFSCPAEKEAEAIATFLDRIEDKIELNQKMNQTLEEIAKAIFKSWFVDFDPVRAKAEGRPTGLPPEISDLFPDELVDSEIGEIPKGWSVSTLGDLVSPKKGKSITKKKVVEGSVPVVAGGLSPAYYHNTSNVKAPTVTVSASGANAGFAKLYNEDIWASDCSYISGQQTPFVFLWYVFLKIHQAKIYHMQQGAAQPHIYPSDLMRLQLAYPESDELWCRALDLIAPMFLRIGNADKESVVLSELRDTLLPKLISGELRIPDAEKFLEEAGI